MEDVIVELEFTYVRSNIILLQLLYDNNIYLSQGLTTFFFYSPRRSAFRRSFPLLPFVAPFVSSLREWISTRRAISRAFRDDRAFRACCPRMNNVWSIRPEFSIKSPLPGYSRLPFYYFEEETGLWLYAKS